MSSDSTPTGSTGPVFRNAFAGKRVVVTGHTGFKGSWLTAWLLELGADVTGLALAPHTDPNAFDLLDLAGRIDHRLGDVRDADMIARLIAETRPAFVFHLAAQALVREGYASPRETYGTNVMGTVNVLDAVRLAGRACTALIITTDKCYHIGSEPRRYAETDRLGGRDPYSSSKACTEFVTEAYRRSYFPVETHASHGVALASARAGNVIGGGDWAAERLVPDVMRALAAGDEVLIRSPDAVRPWQHVLEPLSGYLWLASRMATEGPSGLAEAWNFGPRPEDHITVSGLVEAILRHWGEGTWRSTREADAPHEAAYLGLDCAKARDRLDWQPVYDLASAIEATVGWYKRWRAGDAMREFTLQQISRYVSDAAAGDAAWARDDGMTGA